jgi:micrococcal nuclease
VARPTDPVHPFAVLASLVALSACAPAMPTDGTATVVEVIDGDTITVELGARTEDVRLLGVDTPETKHPSRPVECFGAEAAAFTADLLPPGTPVRLERDEEARDAYGRLLAYVRRTPDDVFVNLELVRRGYADVLVIAPNDAYAPLLRQAGAQARDEAQGLWGACGGADVPTTGTSAPAGQAVPSPP